MDEVVVKKKRAKGDRDAIPDIVTFVECQEYLGLSISVCQRTLLKALYGLPLDEEELEMFCLCTGRETYAPPAGGWPRATVIAGRQSGKDSRIACPIALYEAIYGDWWRWAAKGQRIVIPLVAQNADGTRVALKYISDYAAASNRINRWIDDDKTKVLQVRNACAGLQDPPVDVTAYIECYPCSAKALRGPGVPAAVMDEVAFFRAEGSEKLDREVQRAMTPAGAMFRGRQRLVKISSPSIKDGLMYDDWMRYWGKNHPRILVWASADGAVPTLLMNPMASQQMIDDEREDDPASAMVEFDGSWASDSSGFLSQENVEAVVDRGVFERAPVAGTRYLAAVDPSGGADDAFALTIIHVEHPATPEQVIVQDFMRGWRGTRGAKLQLDPVVAEIAAILARYNLADVYGDRFAAEWPPQKFLEHKVSYREVGRARTDAYLVLEPWINSGSVRLLDHAVMIREALLLEKRITKEGRPKVNHPKGGHDDHVNALAHAVAQLASSLHAPVTVTRESVVAQQALTPGQVLEADAARGVGSLLGDEGRGSLRFHGTGNGRRNRMWR